MCATAPPAAINCPRVLGSPTPTQTPDGDISLALLIAAVSLAALATVLAIIATQRRRQRRAIERLCREHGFSPCLDHDAQAPARDALRRLFGTGGLVLDALHRRAGELQLHVIRFRFPLYRVDADGQWDPSLQESAHKLVVAVTGPGLEDLPAFRLTPNNWMINMIAGRHRNLFLLVEPFGRWNYVYGPQVQRIHGLFDDELQRAGVLRRNTRLVIDARPGVVGYYQMGAMRVDAALPAFVEQCVELTRLLKRRAQAQARQPRRPAVSSVLR